MGLWVHFTHEFESMPLTQGSGGEGSHHPMLWASNHFELHLQRFNRLGLSSELGYELKKMLGIQAYPANGWPSLIL